MHLPIDTINVVLGRFAHAQVHGYDLDPSTAADPSCTCDECRALRVLHDVEL